MNEEPAGGFGSVEDVFITGFESWGELGQMQGPLLGSNGPGGHGGAGSASGSTSSNGTRGAGGVNTGAQLSSLSVSNSMHSFLGEAGLYQEGAVEGFKGADLAEACKMEPLDDPEQEHDHEDENEDDDGNQSDDMDDAKSCPGSTAGADGSRGEDGNYRGLGRIFGVGTHPVVAEAQARAEALVHGRGGKGGGGSGGAGAEAVEKKRKRAALSKEERAKQNRDRNREHARNTRLRKKAFVEELKKQVEELAAAKEREDRERHQESRRDSSLREMRLQILLTFLEYRGRGEYSRQAWNSVIDSRFEMRIPLTPYRAFPQSQVQGGMRVIKGVDEVIADSLSLAAVAAVTSGASSNHLSPSPPTGKVVRQRKSGQNTGKSEGVLKRELSKSRVAGSSTSESSSGGESGGGRRGRDTGGSGTGAPAVVPTRLQYVVDPKEVMVNKNAFMCPFLARSPHMLVPGMLRCTFSAKSNRLSSLQMSFDPTVPARQLARAGAMSIMRSTPFVPSASSGIAVQGIGLNSGVAGQLSSTILAGNSAVQAPGLQTSNTLQASQDPRRLAASPTPGLAGQGEGVLQSVLEDIRAWRVSSTLMDDPQQGKSYLRIYPLSGDTPGVTHFIGVLENLSASHGGVPGSEVRGSPTVAASLSTSDVPAGGNSSAEAGSEGETSSDSTGSTGRSLRATAARAVSAGTTIVGDAGPSTGRLAQAGMSDVKHESGSDDGTGSIGTRSTRSVSAATTTAGASDSGGSGYDTRRTSTRRSAQTSPGARHAVPPSKFGRAS